MLYCRGPFNAGDENLQITLDLLDNSVRTTIALINSYKRPYKANYLAMIDGKNNNGEEYDANLEFPHVFRYSALIFSLLSLNDFEINRKNDGVVIRFFYD